MTRITIGYYFNLHYTCIQPAVYDINFSSPLTVKCIKDVQKTFDDKTLECAKSCVPPCRYDFSLRFSKNAYACVNILEGQLFFCIRCVKPAYRRLSFEL